MGIMCDVSYNPIRVIEHTCHHVPLGDYTIETLVVINTKNEPPRSLITGS